MAEKTKKVKRPVNLSLNPDLVAEARSVTDNLSEAVESLLADFVARERARRVSHAQTLKEAIVTWNNFAAKHGSFADEHSTL
jgi:post-segregation antitoxin (ccd killing protein)